MAEANRTAVYGGLALIVVAAFWYLSQSPEPAKTPPPTTKRAPSAKDITSDLTAEDFTARFSPANLKLRNVFVPAIKGDGVLGGTTANDDQHIPSAFAGGESDWTFKGIAETGGKRMALLQNDTKHQGGYVTLGEHWKTSHLVEISIDKIVLKDDAGDKQVVMRYVPPATAGPSDKSAVAANTLPAVPPPNAGLNPADPNGAMIGPIGRPGRRSVSFQPGGAVIISQ